MPISEDERLQLSTEEERQELRNHPGFANIPRIIVEKLIEGLDATEIKTASYQGQIMESRPFIDYAARLRYIQVTCDIGNLCDVKFSFQVQREDELARMSDEELLAKAKALEAKLGITSASGDLAAARPKRTRIKKTDSDK